MSSANPTDLVANKFVSITEQQLGLNRVTNPAVAALQANAPSTKQYAFDLFSGTPRPPSFRDIRVLNDFVYTDADKNQYMYMVFNTDSNASYRPTDSLVEIDEVMRDNADNPASTYVYFTNQYEHTHDKNYVAKVRLVKDVARMLLVNDETDDFVHGFQKRIVKRTRFVGGNSSGQIEYDEIQLVPSPQLSTYAMLSAYIDVAFKIIPVLPSALRSILQRDNETSADYAELLKTILVPTDSFVPIVYIKQSTSLFHTSGGVSGQTNRPYQHINYPNPSKRDFTRFYPCFDTVMLSTNASRSATAFNGLSYAKYYATQEYAFNPPTGSGRHTVLHIHAFNGHPYNEMFLHNLYELMHRVNGSVSCKTITVLIWRGSAKHAFGTRTVDITDSADVDIISPYHNGDTKMSDQTIAWFMTANRDTLPVLFLSEAIEKLSYIDTTKLT